MWLVNYLSISVNLMFTLLVSPKIKVMLLFFLIPKIILLNRLFETLHISQSLHSKCFRAYSHLILNYYFTFILKLTVNTHQHKRIQQTVAFYAEY